MAEKSDVNDDADVPVTLAAAVVVVPLDGVLPDEPQAASDEATTAARDTTPARFIEIFIVIITPTVSWLPELTHHAFEYLSFVYYALA
jgi:hypothetical protein